LKYVCVLLLMFARVIVARGIAYMPFGGFIIDDCIACTQQRYCADNSGLRRNRSMRFLAALHRYLPLLHRLLLRNALPLRYHCLFCSPACRCATCAYAFLRCAYRAHYLAAAFTRLLPTATRTPAMPHALRFYTFRSLHAAAAHAPLPAARLLRHCLLRLRACP